MSNSLNNNKNSKTKNQNINEGDVYSNDTNEYSTFVKTDDDIENEEFSINKSKKSKLTGYAAAKDLVMEDINAGPHDDSLNFATNQRQISKRESDYQGKKRMRNLSPDRHDPLKDFGKAPDPTSRTYKDIILEQSLENERQGILKEAQKQSETKKKEKEKEKNQFDNGNKKQKSDNTSIASGGSNTTKLTNKSQSQQSEWDKIDKTPNPNSKWDTPVRNDNNLLGSQRRKRWDLTPVGDLDATPNLKGAKGNETPTPNRYAKQKNNNMETPTGNMNGKAKWEAQTPLRSNNIQSTPGGSDVYGATPTPQGAFNMPTPSPGILHSGLTPLGSITPERIQIMKWEKEINERNKTFTDEELDQILPREGYEIIKPPENYQPIMTPSRKLMSTPTPYGQTPLYQIPDGTGKPYELQSTPVDGSNGMPSIKPEDIGHFSTLLNEVDESKMTVEEVKNGTPPMRKSALRQITEKAREFGAGPLFNQILPLLMSPTLEDQERHLLVKVIDRILYKLDDLVRPYVHKILVVIEPLLIDEDYYARVEGREIISNLAKAAGLATMISTMRPDIDHNDEYVRNTTARAFAVVASALSIPSILPFLKAVCQSKKSWQARHTGIKIIQQIAILMGCAILPYLKSLVEIIEHGLKDEQQKVRTITALALAALAEASTPYGYDAFENVINSLFDGIRLYRGKGLAAFLKAIGFIIPLMDSDLASTYTKMVIPALRREFATPDEEMKKIILKVVKQCVSTEGVDANFIRNELLPDFFKHFWSRRMALDRKNYKQLVDTTLEIAIKVGGCEIITRVVEYLKDENEPYRKMVLEIIEKIVATLGVADISSKLEELIMDGLLFSFLEQTSDDTHIVINGFGTIVNCFGLRVKPFIPQICGSIQWRFSHRSAKVRQQAADLISKIATVMKTCGEEMLMGKLGIVLFEYLGEEYPEVLGSILGALKAIVSVIGMTKMTPPIKDLLPRLTPILKNRHEKVQENCIDLVGRIADRGASFVTAKEWMRICFDLLDLLKAHKKGIRRATINTFGYIAKAIGPQDVLVTLLNNLKVQERQNRVCTTVAIAIVAESCGPYTVLPALMNEYRVPELNVQNGVLKSFCFMFEYIGEMAKDYIYSVIPLLEDALTDRDLVHRQTAAAAIKHLSLGVAYLNCEDALVHLRNFIWPNIFETSPHVINAVMEGIEGLRVGLGVGRLMLYVVQGLFHPARRVRDVYWKLYNMMYIGAADSMICNFPKLPNTQKNNYTRSELELFI